jgi:hypothetical protein
MLSGKGNARERNLFSVLKTLGLEFQVQPIRSSSRHPHRSTLGERIGQSARIRRSVSTGQLAVPFVAAGYAYRQPSASGMKTLTIAASPFSANVAAMVTEFGSKQSSVQGEVEPFFPLISARGYWQGIVRNISWVADKIQQTETGFAVIPKYGFQSVARHDPVRELTHLNIGEVS